MKFYRNFILNNFGEQQEVLAKLNLMDTNKRYFRSKLII